jgi:hypothetical protein
MHGVREESGNRKNSCNLVFDISWNIVAEKNGGFV